MVSPQFSENIAAVFLGLILLAIVGGVILLAWDGAETPNILEFIGSAAVGGLVAQLARSDNDG